MIQAASRNSFYKKTIGIEKKNITLRNRLIPVPQTEEYLKNNRSLFRDDARNQAYQVVKRILDREHRNVIDRVLNYIKEQKIIEWDKLGELQAKENALPKEVENAQKKVRKIIADALKNDDIGKQLKGKNAFGRKGYLSSIVLNEDEKNAVEEFGGFSIFFDNYNKNRENMYSAEEIEVAVAYRTVNENFDKYLHNKTIYERICLEVPELVKEFAIEAKRKGFKWNAFVFDSFVGMNQAMMQSDIDEYNNLVSVINFVANLYEQKHQNELSEQSIFKKRKNYKMIPLFKQILSITNPKIVIEQCNNDKEAITLLKSLYEFLSDEAEGSIRNQIETFIEDVTTVDLEKIYINAGDLTQVSMWIGGHWDYLNRALSDYYRNELSQKMPETKLDDAVEKQMRAKTFCLAEIDKALEYRNRFIEQMEDKIQYVHITYLWSYLRDKLYSKAKDCSDAYDKFINDYSYEHSLQEVDISPVKEYLDSWLNVVRFFKSFAIKDNDNIKVSDDFYGRVKSILFEMRDFVNVYNMIRNYVTRKPYSSNKVLLKFGKPTLADGWSIDKEREYGVAILRNDEKYYLAIYNPKCKDLIPTDSTLEKDYYEKMEYNLFKDVSKMIPKCSTELNAVKSHFANCSDDYTLAGGRFNRELIISKEIFDLNHKLYQGYKKWQKDYLRVVGDEAGYHDAVTKWNRFCIDFVKSYSSTADYDYSKIKRAEEYESVSDLYHDLDKLFYRIQFTRVDANDINRLLDSNQIFLFQIYNQDYAKGKHSESKKNLHTLYWEALFSEENIKERVIMLNGGAEIFERPGSIKNKVVHQAGSVMINKNTADGKTIPPEVYVELLHGLRIEKDGSVIKGGLSEKADKFYEENKEKIRVFTKKYDITKDKRYTENQYFFHVPVTINFQADGAKQFNITMLKNLQESINEGEDICLIGLDRGERNLIAYSVIDLNGKIVDQGTFNRINSTDYQDKLTQKQKARDEERKNWKTIENIKELKEGYVSQVIHELVKLMIKHNAIIVMEELNYSFKRGRFKMEKQVYQKFEMALLNKLQYLVCTKDEAEALKPGGVLKGYQLTMMPQSLREVGHQCGAVLYVPPAYTSKIDPTTGFVDVFNYQKLVNNKARKEFFTKFEDIMYDSELDSFAFSFDYSKFDVYVMFEKACWTAYSTIRSEVGKHTYNKIKKEFLCDNTTKLLKEQFEKEGIDYKEKLKEQILSVPEEHAEFWKELVRIFKIMLRLRDSANIAERDGTIKVIDRIISPVKNSTGVFFATPMEITEESRRSSLPMDADTNGAYHIALKGLYLISEKLMKSQIEDEDKLPKDFYKISHLDWFKYTQITRQESE